MPENHRGLHYVAHDMRPPWLPPARPVLFHHGIGTDHRIWSAWLSTIAAAHPVLAFDMRGCGASVVPHADHAWTLQEMVEDLWSVAALAGDGPIHLVGESIGGLIVLAAAAAHPERVASVWISNAPYTGRALRELGHWSGQYQEGGAAGWSEHMMNSRFAPGVGDARALAWFEAVQRAAPRHVVLGLAGLLTATDLGPLLPRLDMPVMAVLPDQSPFVPVEQGRRLCELAPRARLRVVPGVRHGLPFSHAREESARLLSFLDAVEAGVTPAA